MDTTIVAETPDIGLATFLHEILIGAGIEAELASEGGSSVLPTIGVGSYAVIVKTADADAARALIDEAESTDASAEGAARRGAHRERGQPDEAPREESPTRPEWRR